MVVEGATVGVNGCPEQAHAVDVRDAGEEPSEGVRKGERLTIPCTNNSQSDELLSECLTLGAAITERHVEQRAHDEDNEHDRASNSASRVVRKRVAELVICRCQQPATQADTEANQHADDGEVDQPGRDPGGEWRKRCQFVEN